MFNLMNLKRESLLDSVISLCYFMRGSIQYDKLFECTFIERRAIELFIEKRLESEAKKVTPVY
mgnify:CR=1 FL=1